MPNVTKDLSQKGSTCRAKTPVSGPAKTVGESGSLTLKAEACGPRCCVEYSYDFGHKGIFLEYILA